MSEPSQIERRAGLVVVSNRLPYNLPAKSSSRPPKRNVGGLVNALEPVLAEGRGRWIGWDGAAATSAPRVEELMREGRTLRTESGVELHGVPLTDREVARFYHGLSNRTLWPLFHNILDKTVFSSDDWTTYVRVNRRFAEVVYEHAGAHDRIWVHDYHLMLVPRFLRELGFRGRIDFFLHIPFPAPEVFLAVPWRRDLVLGLLHADAAAFHIAAYRDNFVRAASLVLREPLSSARHGDETRIRHPHGSTVAAVAPIGIDVADFERISRLDRTVMTADRVRRSLGHRKILFGADRLDYTKGIKERMLAIERFLNKFPERAGEFVLLQVVVPSRSQVEEYRSLKYEIDQSVGRINGTFGRDGWVPIHYQYRAMSRDELVAHYLAARAALVTPLRDGMNLVAPEFVASRTDDDGVLVLSEFAGVAERLKDSLRVNPYDQDGCAAALGLALDMAPGERSARMQRLRAAVAGNNLDEWVTRCLTAGLRKDEGPRPLNRRASRRRRRPDLPPRARPAADPVSELVARVAAASRRSGAMRTLLLDLDGTLAPIAPTPEAARVPPPTRTAIEHLLAHGWRIAIVSGRPAAEVHHMLPVEGLSVFGSHGLEGSWPGKASRRLDHLSARFEQLAEGLERLAGDYEGVRIEGKPAGVAAHDRLLAEDRLGSWHRALGAWLDRQDLNGIDRLEGRRVLELRPHGVHKGLVVRALTLPAGTPRPDESLLAIGDDRTDEDMFRELADLGLAIRVGSRSQATAASERLPSPYSVQRMLSLLAEQA